jgi:ribonuclease E
MQKQIVIAEQYRIGAVFWEDRIQELIVATGQNQVGDVYLGVVENVLPGIDAAFVNIGDPERNGFIHVTDLGPLRLRQSAGGIAELLAPQQKVLVQVMKEPTGNKGPRLTGDVSLPGRYAVLMPFGKGVNLSRRIRNENERNRLRALAILTKPAGMGILIRTEAEGKSEEAIVEDIENLQKQWELTQQQANSTRAPALIDRDSDFIQRVLRDIYAEDVNRIVVDTPAGLKRVKNALSSWNNGKLPEGVYFDYHRERLPILDYFRINPAIREALKPRVDLPSGGYIIIQPTEALTVIDVNSGSFTKSATSRETVLWTNCEAAKEIARQLRLRNLAGVIVIDFIDMDHRKDQLQVLEQFNKHLRTDKARPQIAQLTELGLVELTRKRQGQNVYELFGRTCQHCGGLGHLAHLPGESNAREEDEFSSSESRFQPLVNTTGQESQGTYFDNRSRAGGEASHGEFNRPSRFRAASRGDRHDETLLLNHPSYQERHRFDKKQRRRRFGRPGFETGGEERPTETTSIYETPNPNPNTFDSSSDYSSRFDRPTEPPRSARFPLNRREDKYPAPPVVVDREYLPVESKTDSFEAEPEIEDDRQTNGDSENFRTPVKPTRYPVEPPEVVTVVMSAEKKEMYAWMGVSPLSEYGGEIRNPRNAIVKIVDSETGESIAIDNISAAMEEPDIVDILDLGAMDDNDDIEIDRDITTSVRSDRQIPLPLIPEDLVLTAVTPAVREEENTQRTMRRTRKSSRSDVATPEIPPPEAIVAIVPPIETTSEEPIAVGVTADSATDDGDDNAPRRRRRRSSAD